MARAHDSMIYPPIEELLDRVDSKFSLVTLAAKRARQINSYFAHLGEGGGKVIPPQVSSVARKPLSIGFEEIAADKIVRVPAEEMADEDLVAEGLPAGDQAAEPAAEAEADTSAVDGDAGSTD